MVSLPARKPPGRRVWLRLRDACCAGRAEQEKKSLSVSTPSIEQDELDFLGAGLRAAWADCNKGSFLDFFLADGNDSAEVQGQSWPPVSLKSESFGSAWRPNKSFAPTASRSSHFLWEGELTGQHHLLVTDKIKHRSWKENLGHPNLASGSCF
jgi:hypothetical protein